jgi:hypothetical protein
MPPDFVRTLLPSDVEIRTLYCSYRRCEGSFLDSTETSSRTAGPCSTTAAEGTIPASDFDSRSKCSVTDSEASCSSLSERWLSVPGLMKFGKNCLMSLQTSSCKLVNHLGTVLGFCTTTLGLLSYYFGRCEKGAILGFPSLYDY